jgi:selenophosphate synthase
VVGFEDAGVYRLDHDLAYDPESSGGLLIALNEDDVARFQNGASQASFDYWAIVRFTHEPKGRIRLR